jgi:hypothetical protein
MQLEAALRGEDEKHFGGPGDDGAYCHHLSDRGGLPDESSRRSDWSDANSTKKTWTEGGEGAGGGGGGGEGCVGDPGFTNGAI